MKFPRALIYQELFVRKYQLLLIINLLRIRKIEPRSLDCRSSKLSTTPPGPSSFRVHFYDNYTVTYGAQYDFLRPPHSQEHSLCE